MPTEDLYGLGASGIPPELAAKMMGLKNQQAIAQALMNQGQDPLQAPESKGRFTAAINPLSALSKVFQSYAGAKALQETSKEYTDIAKQHGDMEKSAIEKVTAARMGQPAIPQPAAELGGGPGRPAIPPTPEQLQQANADAIMSPYGKVQRYGTMMEKSDEAQNLLALKNKESAIAREESAKNRLAQIEAAKITAGTKDKPLSLTEVIDPSNTQQLLRIDAKLYKGGSIGSPGVIGVSGKEPTAAAKEQKLMVGKEGLAGTLLSLETAYKKLDEMGGIVNNKKGSLSNLGSRIASSGVGQFAGGVIGSDEQSIRNEIKGTVPLLILDIKNATGASAQQMNSNIELQNFLRAASDPASDVRSNLKLLDNLRKKYVNIESPKHNESNSEPIVVYW